MCGSVNAVQDGGPEQLLVHAIIVMCWKEESIKNNTMYMENKIKKHLSETLRSYVYCLRLDSISLF